MNKLQKQSNKLKANKENNHSGVKSKYRHPVAV
jgi:hypothetical protein